MKKVLLILLMLILPWQAMAAAERNLTHVLGGGQRPELVIKHIAEHAAHVLHHHHDEDDDDDDNLASTNGAPHVDHSQKSMHHLADYEQGCNMNILLPALQAPGLPVAERIAPLSLPAVFSNRTTIPLLRPPRAFA